MSRLFSGHWACTPPPPPEKILGSAHVEVYATRHDPKRYLHTKFGIPTSNYIQICSGLDLARTETRGQGHSDLETVGDSPGPKMCLHTKYGTATINNIGDLLCMHISRTGS